MQSEHEKYFIKENRRSLLFSENAIKIRDWSESEGYGVRVLSGGRLGFTYCDAQSGVAGAISKAAELAKYSPKSDFAFPDKKPFKSVQCHDPNISGCDVLRLKEMVLEIKDEIIKGGAKPRVYVSVGESLAKIENTSGLNAEYGKTMASIYAEATRDSGYGYSYYSSSFLPAEELRAFGEKAAAMAKEMESAKPAEKGKCVAVFSAEAFSSLLDVLLPSFSGDWKRKGITTLADKAGKKILSESISIYDDATARALESRPFDDEGTPSKIIPLIENGVVKNFLFDLETAALARDKSKGNCSRAGFDSRPAISSSNIVVAPGSHGDFESGLNEFLLVESLHGTHTSNTTTGDFGVEVNVAFLVKKGRREAKKGFMISGNIFELFNNVHAIEKKQHTVGNLVAPRIAFSGVSVTS